MPISESMRARGDAVGLTPGSDESPQAFGARVRKAEKSQPKDPAPAPKGDKPLIGLGRRGFSLPN